MLKLFRTTVAFLMVISLLLSATEIGDAPDYQGRILPTEKSPASEYLEYGGKPIPESDVKTIEGVDVTRNEIFKSIVQKRETGFFNQDWDDDILVMGDSAADSPILFNLRNDSVYAIYNYSDAYITVMLSEDGGDNWSYKGDYTFNPSTDLYNIDACLDEEGDSTFIFVICNAESDEIWLFRYNITGGYNDWVNITVGSVYDPAIDDIGSTNDVLYMTYLVYDNMLRFRSSSDYGKNWTAPYYVDSGYTMYNPDIRISSSIGTTNVWGFIIWDNQPVVYSKANQWDGFDGWRTTPRNTHNFRGSSDDKNPQINGPFDSDRKWVIAEENKGNTGDWNLVWDYTTDGLNWRCDTMFPDIEIADDTLRDEMSFYLQHYGPTTSATSTRVAYYSIGSPSDIRVDYGFFSGSWSITEDINQYNARAGTHPSVDYVPSAGGGAVLYKSQGSGIWYDYYFNSGLTEENDIPSVPLALSIPSIPLGAGIDVNFSIENNSRVVMKIFDATGRMLDRVHEGFYNAGSHRININPELNRGVYFLRAETENTSVTKSFIILR